MRRGDFVLRGREASGEVIWLLAGQALAQSCSCSVGGTDGVTPAGPVPRPGGLALAVEYGATQIGGEGWQGVHVTERGGNSMPEMAMPGHFVQTARANVTLGVGDGVALYASVPWIDTHPLYPSDMPGDVDAQFMGDVGVGGRWGRARGDVFTSVGGGLTLPTGKVLPDGGIRGGRGSLGVTARAEILDLVTPHVEVGGAISAAGSLYPTPDSGYLVGPTASGSAGVRLWPREQGRTRFDEFLVLQQQANDRAGVAVLYETGATTLAYQSAFSWRFWADKNRSASFTVRGQLPIAQVVGDPWLAQNWSVAAGLGVVAL